MGQRTGRLDLSVSKEDALREFDADKMTGAIRQKSRRHPRQRARRQRLPICVANVMGLSFIKTGSCRIAAGALWVTFSDVLKDMAEYLPDE